MQNNMDWYDCKHTTCVLCPYATAWEIDRLFRIWWFKVRSQLWEANAHLGRWVIIFCVGLKETLNIKYPDCSPNIYSFWHVQKHTLASSHAYQKILEGGKPLPWTVGKTAFLFIVQRRPQHLWLQRKQTEQIEVHDSEFHTEPHFNMCMSRARYTPEQGSFLECPVVHRGCSGKYDQSSNHTGRIWVVDHGSYCAAGRSIWYHC